MIKKLIGITVSVHCTSVLELTLPLNLPHFVRWYLVTDPNDLETINMCQGHSEKLDLITFDFFRQAIFNKGGGILAAQKIAHNSHPEASILIMDTDILLPANIHEVLADLAFEKDTIFGASGRHDYASVSALLKNEYVDYKYGNCVTGFFQLYSDKMKYYQPSHSIDKCDDVFRDSFNNQVLIDRLLLRHLGNSGYGIRYLEQPDKENWDGKNSQPQFNLDRPVDFLDLKYSV